MNWCVRFGLNKKVLCENLNKLDYVVLKPRDFAKYKIGVF